MSDPRDDQEKSVEEILASIRRIISDDGPPPTAEPAPPDVAPSLYPTEVQEAPFGPAPLGRPSEPQAAPSKAAPSPRAPQSSAPRSIAASRNDRPPEPPASGRSGRVEPTIDIPPMTRPDAGKPTGTGAASGTAVPSVPPGATTRIERGPAPTGQSVAEARARRLARWAREKDTTPGGDELVLTKMVAADGSVVALDRATGPGEGLRAQEPTDAGADQPAPPPAGERSSPVGRATAQAAVESAGGAINGGSASQPASLPAAGGLTVEELVRQILEPKIGDELVRQIVESRIGDELLREALPPKLMEDLARQMIAPKIQEWLDSNLSSVVERLVRQKLERRDGDSG
jgi:cell pole-organizing protein PopZ